MMKLHKQFCSVLGIGYINKGGGTVAAIAACLVWWILAKWVIDRPLVMLAPIVLVVIAGIRSAGKMEPGWGKDNKKVVIDEVAGMWVSLLFIPVTVYHILAAFFLFRFFDIVKPLFIRETEKMPGGWGVMLDDLLAGIYSNLFLQLIIACNLFN